MTVPNKYRLYACGICGELHPWHWGSDCRVDGCRYCNVENYAERTGISAYDVEVSTWEERIEADEKHEAAGPLSE